ncbi:hypothetical protein LQV05_006544 [Cryptococcus neoformans]|nr:hypothetical protein LQV05_006544 [Cryptococcus neoformans]
MATDINKKRKIQRACDICRKKKIKCDGPMNSLSSHKCAYCTERDLECTYIEEAQRRGPPKGYLETMEQRCGRLEKLLQQARHLHPDFNFDSYVGPPIDRQTFDLVTYRDLLDTLDIPSYPSQKPIAIDDSRLELSPSDPSVTSLSSSASPANSLSNLKRILTRFYKAVGLDTQGESDTEETEMEARTQLSVAESIKRMGARDHHWRYHGTASGIQFITHLQELRSRAASRGMDFISCVNRVKRQQFWEVPEWELAIASEGLSPLDLSSWPEKGLDQRLIDAYFDHVNLHLPLLNRKIFQEQYDSCKWKNHHGFARVCLLLFANGARYLDDDPRVIWPLDQCTSESGRDTIINDPHDLRRYSAGWRYVRSYLRMGQSIVQGPNLFELQSRVLTCQFVAGTAIPHFIWIVAGYGLRSAQELGIHMRATLLHADPIERELCSRAFWCLYHIDRVSCSAVGRTIAIQDYDFDLQYPADVDDEYWSTEDREKDFQQPVGKGPSMLATFIETLKLDHIVGAALQTIHTHSKGWLKPKEITANYAVLAELDSALNDWEKQVPQALKWNPHQSNARLFKQCALLYCRYHYVRMLIHKPFVPIQYKAKKQHSDALPSLRICAEAARSLAGILDACLVRGRREQYRPSVDVEMALPMWNAATILLVDIFSGKQTASERETALMCLRCCQQASAVLEGTWRQVAKYSDFLVSLMDESIMPPTVDESRAGSEKRTRQDDGGGRSKKRAWRAGSEPIMGSRGEDEGGNSQSRSHSRMDTLVPQQEPTNTLFVGNDIPSVSSTSTYNIPNPNMQLPSFPYSQARGEYPSQPSPAAFVPSDQDTFQSSDIMYDWLMNMASAAPQTLSMSSMALGGAEGGIDDPIWAQLFGDTVFFSQ